MTLNMTHSRIASIAATGAVTAVVLAGCSASGDTAHDETESTYPGQLVGTDGTLTIGNAVATADSMNVTCSEDGGVITATISEPESGNTVTTTQPDGGEGYAAATLTSDGNEYKFIPREGITAADVEKLVTERSEDVPPIFENENQYGSPIKWASDGTADLYLGLHQQAPGETAVSVDMPRGTLDCSKNAAG